MHSVVFVEVEHNANIGMLTGNFNMLIFSRYNVDFIDIS